MRLSERKVKRFVVLRHSAAEQSGNDCAARRFPHSGPRQFHARRSNGTTSALRRFARGRQYQANLTQALPSFPIVTQRIPPSLWHGFSPLFRWPPWRGPSRWCTEGGHTRWCTHLRPLVGASTPPCNPHLATADHRSARNPRLRFCTCGTLPPCKRSSSALSAHVLAARGRTLDMF